MTKSGLFQAGDVVRRTRALDSWPFDEQPCIVRYVSGNHMCVSPCGGSGSAWGLTYLFAAVEQQVSLGDTVAVHAPWTAQVPRQRVALRRAICLEKDLL